MAVDNELNPAFYDASPFSSFIFRWRGLRRNVEPADQANNFTWHWCARPSLVQTLGASFQAFLLFSGRRMTATSPAIQPLLDFFVRVP